jgi:hypothetical protein
MNSLKKTFFNAIGIWNPVNQGFQHNVFNQEIMWENSCSRNSPK